MLRVLILGVLAPAGLGLPLSTELQLHSSQCVEHDCFALFRERQSFPSASQACERLQGHLMTVRSSVAADVISLLLSGDSGDGPRLWIGLQHPPGCSPPEHLGLLRGFQWVTGDNGTSYSKWARITDGEPLCGPLCVVVAPAGAPVPGEPAWEVQDCNEEVEGFLCEFHFAASCRPLIVESGAAAAANVSISYSTPFGGHSADFQALPVGSSATVGPFGLQLVCDRAPGEAEARWGREAAGAWDCRVENGGCSHTCNGISGTPQCLCPPDTTLQPDGRSCDIAPQEHPCHKLCEQFCIPSTSGSYSCMCATGYQLAADQHHCEDVDDCLVVPSLCPQRCKNTPGGFDCYCNVGFELQNGECVELLDPCAHNNCEYQCQQVGQTGYRCFCAPGFAPVPQEPHRCQMFCNQTQCPADCDPNTPTLCHCPEGFILDEGYKCTDIDECDNGYCSHECINLPGSYQCLCGPGTALAGQLATDCDPVTISDKNTDDDGGSGEVPVSPTPSTTLSPSPARPMHSGVLIGISIASLSLVVALLALLCHLRKKQGILRAELEYKCGSPAKDVVLQHVRTEPMLQSQKL